MTMKDFYRYQTGEKIRFSTEVPEVGSLYRSNGPLPYLPSYSKIGLSGVLVLPAVIVKQTKTEPGYEKTPERAYNYEITGDCSVLVDGYFVAQPPVKHDTGKKFTQSERVKFCKAVIWQLMNDEETLRETIQNISTIHESVIVPEVIAVPEEIVLPEHLNAYTPEGIMGYPSAEVVEDLLLRHSINYEVEIEEIERDLFEGYYDSCTSEHMDSLSLENEYNKGEEVVLYDLVYPAVHPVVIRSWTHGSMVITEEARA